MGLSVSYKDRHRAQIAAATEIDREASQFVLTVQGNSFRWGNKRSEGGSRENGTGHRILKCILGHAVFRRVIRALEQGTVAPPPEKHPPFIIISTYLTHMGR